MYEIREAGLADVRSLPACRTYTNHNSTGYAEGSQARPVPRVTSTEYE